MIIKKRPQKLNATDRRVLRFVLSSLKSSSGGLFSQTPREVATALRLPLRTVERSYQRLLTRGILVVAARPRTKGHAGKPGHPLPTAYRVQVPVGVEMPFELAHELAKMSNGDETATPTHTVAAIGLTAGDGLAVSSATRTPVNPLEADTATPIDKVCHLLPNKLSKETNRPISQTDMTDDLPHKTYVGVAVSSNKGLSTSPTADIEDLRRRLAHAQMCAVKFANDPFGSVWVGAVKKLEQAIEELSKEAVCTR